MGRLALPCSPGQGSSLVQEEIDEQEPARWSNFGSPGAGVICSCSSSILFLEQSAASER
jgi:hypothetical protein